MIYIRLVHWLNWRIRQISFKKVVLLSDTEDVHSFIKEFVNFEKKIMIVPKDTPISHLKQNLFKI